jgi:hypothetical protein
MPEPVFIRTALILSVVPAEQLELKIPRQTTQNMPILVIIGMYYVVGYSKLAKIKLPQTAYRN